MKIQTVTFSRLVSGPSFSNTTISATATLDAEEAPENALAELETWVGYQHELRRKTSDELYQADQTLWDARSQLGKLTSQIEAAKERFEAVKVVSAALGVDLTKPLGKEGMTLDDVPF